MKSSGRSARAWLWRLDSMEAEPLPGTTGAQRPFWSTQQWGGVWNADDVIVFSNAENGFSRVPAGGGEPVVVTRRGQALHDEIPVLLPDRLRRIPLLT